MTPRQRDAYPSYRNHFRPRTRDGLVAVVAFVGLFVFTHPPLVYWIANRIDPILVGVPFLYAYLLGLYCALIAVLIWTHRRRV